MIKILVSIAFPMFVLALALAYKVKRRACNIGTFRWVEVREATAPRAAGWLLITSLLMFGTAGMMFMLDMP